MKVYKGNIITLNDHDDLCKYLVEDKGRILFVGNNLPEEYQNLKICELNNKALIPSFVDTHQHFASFATFNAGLNVMNAQSNDEMLKLIAEFANRSKEKVLIAFGASAHSVTEGRLISKIELDSVCPDKELMVVKYDGHACIVNSKLLNKLKKKVENLRGYHYDSGEMNQESFFVFSNYITNSISIFKLFKNMQRALDYQARQGIGCIHTVSGVGFPFDLDITIEKIFARSINNGFQLRVFPQSMDINAAIKRKLPRIGGCFKCALDGCFGSMDAALIESYQNEQNHGVLYYADEDVISFCKAANRACLQIEMHAIGDAAFDQATKALKAALDDCPHADHRHTIIHACLPTENGMRICQEYHINLAVQSSFISWRQEPDAYLEKILGKKRLLQLNPLKTFYQNSLVIAAGSDAPCTDPNPLSWLDKAVNNPNQEEALSVTEALRMCTLNGYYLGFDDQERGSLEVGKIADMVILSDNPYRINKKDISKLRVESLILGGKEYQSAEENFIKALFRGFISNKKF